MKLSDALSGLGAPVVSVVSGRTIAVAPFRAGVFKSAGGALTLVANGTWFVGVDLFTGAVIALPRLGHRGWVPVAKVVTGASSITSIEQIAPALPVSRIPRTVKKILSGQAISVVVMGSSLTQGGNTTDWPGMLFNAASALTAYRVPGTITAQYRGVGGSPNQYQLAQLGFASGHTAYGFPGSGFPLAITAKAPPNGRSAMFSGVDLVVLGCLANGGDYRLECIEPLIRKLRQAGVEVIVTTDNPQGPSAAYSTMSTAGLYVDGPEVMRIADLYGVEIADTAAYVFEAHLRYGSGIYGDTIHMSGSAPGGRTAAPSCGHEVWARAIRSVIPIDGQPAAPQTLTYDFASGAQGWTGYNTSAVDASTGSLVITKNTASTGQWGGWITSLPQIYSGDTIRVRGTASRTSGDNVSIGLQYAGWASNSVGIGDGAFDVTLTANHDSTALLFYGGNNAAANGADFVIDDLIIDITHNAGQVIDLFPGRPAESRPLPPIRVVTNFKTPADAFVILPADELMTVGSDARKGVLGAHPWGAGSFARCFYPSTGSTADLLTVATGKGAFLSAHGVVGLSLIRYQDQNDAACTFEVYRNDTLVKTVTLGTVPFGNEWYTTIFTPTEYNQTSASDAGDSIRIAVTSGTLKIAALVALTADIDYLFSEQITFVGNWLAREADGGGNMWGRPTDTPNDFAVVKCTGRRLQWILANRSNSQPVDFYSDREQSLNQAQTGVNHIRAKGGLLGPGAMHTIKLRSAAASPVAGNRSLHIGGAIVINDR